jgi:hypothetical protein
MFEHLYHDVSCSPTETSRALQAHGCIVLRDAIDPAPLAQCHDAVINLFERDRMKQADRQQALSSPAAIKAMRGVKNCPGCAYFCAR